MTIGQKVLYLGRTEATFIREAKNGVIIEMWGKGLKEGQWIRRRVSAKDVRPK